MSLPFDARKLVKAFAADNPDVTQLKFINEDPNGVNIEEVTGGLINYCLRVSSNDGKSSVVLKHAKDTAKGLTTDSLSVSFKRQQLEYECLAFLHSLIPGHVPEPFCLDTTHHIIAMQDLKDWALLGHHLQNMGPSLNVASEMGRVLAKMHQGTSKNNVTPEYWEELSKFRNPEAQTMGYIFLREKYHVDPDKLTHLPRLVKDVYQEYHANFDITDMQDKLGKLIYEERCLVQLDSHWKSVFVKDEHIAMFDFEFAFLGHPGISLGYYVGDFFACFLMYMDKHKATMGILLSSEKRIDCQQKFQKAVVCLMTNYMEGVRDMSDENKGGFISEVALFCGAELALLSLFENITGLDESVTPEVQVSLMHSGFRLMKSYGSIRTIEQLVDAVFKE